MSARLCGLVVALGLLWPASALAIPRFALREGASCAACHMNPSGGGMRNRYGRYVYAPTRLALTYARPLGLSEPLDVDVSDTLAFGADARTAYIDQRPPESEVDDTRTLFAMQADLYVGATPFDGLALLYDQGALGSFEALALYQFGLGHPALSAYVKLGRFMPSFGLRIPNHNVFTRQEVGFGPRDKETAAELGVYVGPVLLQGAVLNGAGEQNLDDNIEKGFVGRAEILRKLGPLGLMLGASLYSNLAGAEAENRGFVVDTRTTHVRRSLHWGASLWRFAYLGEAGTADITPGENNEVDPEEHSFRSYQELAFLAVDGLELVANYEFREPDLEAESGRGYRVSGGFELYPIPGAELLLLVRHSLGSGPAEEADDDFDEIIAMLHVYF